MASQYEPWRDNIGKEMEEKTGKLNLMNSGLTEVPSEIEKMDWLKELYLNGNAIKKIKGLSSLINLKSLYLSYNQITEMEGLSGLTNLEFLFLESNQLTEIKGIANLKKLKRLFLGKNHINNISGLTGLTKLERLYLENNEIEEIKQLTKLEALVRVNLESNKIKSIYPLLHLIKKGLTLSTRPSALIFAGNASLADSNIKIGQNNISDPPLEIIDQGNAAILKYFGEKKTYKVEKLEILKLILVGNSQVGKTNFSQFLREGIIDNATISTHVLDIKKWDADFLVSENNTKTRLHLFDFGGQDYYHDAHRMYYSHDTAYVLLWDTISNEYQEQEEKIDGGIDTILYENYPLPYWLQSINYTLEGKYLDTYHQTENESETAVKESITKAPPILVLQNKIDIANGKLNQEDLSGKYPNIWGYFGVSLLKRKRTEVLKELLSDYLNSLNLTGRMLLSYQLEIVKFFSDNTKNELRIFSLPEFKDACITIVNDSSVVFEERDALIMAHILNNTGIVLFSHEKDESYIFSDINLLNEQIKRIMDYAKKGNDKGVFSMKQVTDDAAIKNETRILQLLCTNKSIIKLNDRDYLAPQFLPTAADKSIQFFLHTFNYVQMRYVYPAYYHKSILLNLFAKYVDASKDAFSLTSRTFPFWRNGIIVSKEDGGVKQMVFIEFVKNKTNAVINIKTMAPFSKQKLEGEIEQLIDDLNKGWTVTKEVSVDNTVFIPTERLMDKYKSKQFEFVRENKKFKINDFKELVHFENMPKRIFISYSSLDKEYLKEFTKQIVTIRNEGLVETWDDRELQAGDKWDIVIKEQLQKADYVILFITANFLNSDYIRDVELKKSLQNNKRIIPVIIDYCTWDYDDDLKEIQVLNKNTPLTSYSPISKGWVEVVNALKVILK